MGKHQITIPVFIPHLGCPHRCIFCDQWSTTPAEAEAGADIVDDTVLRYLPHVRKTVKRIELAFFGGSFTGIKKEIQESFLRRARHHLETGAIHGIRLSTRPDYISNESLALLEKYGVTTVEIGVQSLDDKVLSAASRGHSADDVFAAVECIKRNGFDFVIQLMAGLPGETRESALRTARSAAQAGPSAVRIYPAVVLKGTFLERLWASGEYSPLSMEDAVDLCKDLHRIFMDHDIPIIRTGLHPLGPGQSKNIVAGPYHPSFGFLVKSRVRRDLMAELISRYLVANTVPPHGRIHLVLPDKNTEEFVGSARDNINYLQKRFNLAGIRYSAGPVSDVQIIDERPGSERPRGGINGITL
ncbi:MAG: radical SAM protein [Spirochaetes bacterium]|nr:radical SAM protein [Spirochaetota bacterium]